MSTFSDGTRFGPRRVLRDAAAARPSFLDVELGRAPSLVVVPQVEDDEPQVDPAEEQGYRDGYDAGYADGFVEGRAMGHADGYQAGNQAAADAALAASQEREERLRLALAALGAAADECSARQAAGIGELERTVVDAVFELTETLLGRELSRARTGGRDAVLRALDLVRGHGPVTARLHPDDIDTVGDLAVLVPGRSIELLADPSVEPAGCIVEAGAQRVVAQLGDAIERAKRVLLS
jgi:flagellar assembly protein FliH